MDIIYDDSDIVVINKEAGVESVPSQNSRKSVTQLLQDHLKSREIYPAHRLDRDTSGVLIYAKTKKVLKILEEYFKHRKTQKVYFAVCAGVPRNPEGVIRRNLSSWSGGHRPVKVVKGNEGLKAETEYQLIAYNKDFPASLLLFTPHQGRTHQIRVHAQAFKRPILGDDQYGDRALNKEIKTLAGLKRQALHAWTLTIPNLYDKTKELNFKADIKEDLIETCNALFPDWREILSL